MVEKRLYLFKDGELWFNDFVLVIDGGEFRQKNLHSVHLGDKTTTVGSSTFEGNYLKQIHFHKKIKRIQGRAFANNKIEKIIFSRIEVPEIAKDAFVGNPVELVVVPYEAYDEYKEALAHVEFDREVKIISNIEMKFDKLYAFDQEDMLILIKVKPIYGEYYWRIEKEEITDIETQLKKKTNRFECEEVEMAGTHYHVWKDTNQQYIIYRKENGQYVDLTFDDFEVIYENMRKDIL